MERLVCADCGSVCDEGDYWRPTFEGFYMTPPWFVTRETYAIVLSWVTCLPCLEARLRVPEWR